LLPGLFVTVSQLIAPDNMDIFSKFPERLNLQ